tara:strand:+ start:787 stop:1230 length:444 start_codon:yes stop_codon:yes gene_type:complete
MAIHKIDQVDGVANIPKKFVTLTATGAIAKGQVVSMDFSVLTNGRGFHVKVTDQNDSPLAVGVATEAATAAGDEIRVQVAGFNDDVTLSSGTLSLSAGGNLIGTNTSGNVRELGAANNFTTYFAILVKAFTTTSDGAIFIRDHGYYG